MPTAGTSQRGGALVLSLVVTLGVVGITGAFYSLSLSSARSTSETVFALQALYVAESGAAVCIRDLNRGGPGVLSGRMGGGDYSIALADYGSDLRDNNRDGQIDEAAEANFMELNVEGRYASARRRLQVILSRTAGGVYWNALFAGNSSGDPSYALNLGGRGAQADSVLGDVYSGNNFLKAGDARVSPYRGQAADEHQIMHRGNSTDTSSQSPPPKFLQGEQSIPDIPAMEYEKNHNVNVAQSLQASGSYGLDDAGGRAVQIMDPDNPAHIFRLNPDDRAVLTNSTVKDDYFLEDPTAPVRVDPSQNGADAYPIRLSRGRGNNVVYYIDGNLHLNNRKTYSFKFFHPEPTGVKITFVVKGNIYFGDNLFYLNINKDAVAFIAMKDAVVPDSGNIYFGDPIYGTTKRFEGYMYAENNFYDNNLGTPSSMTTSVFGNMTAGNQVLIKRDKADGSHVKLAVTFDDKIKRGDGPPGLPPTSTSSGGTWSLASWKQTP